MADFETAYAPVKQYEGGWSNDKADRGGETYAGIARNFFPNWAGWEIVDSYKKTVGQNATTLTKTLAAVPTLQKLVLEWYRKEWWDRLGLGNLPQKLADEIFEQSVNLGKAGCGKKVQTICNAYNRGPSGQPYFTDLVLDGAIGPKTLNALAALVAKKTDAENLVHALSGRIAMPEDEILEILLGIIPESFEGWLGVSMAISALLSIILPAPSENAHPVLKIGHKAICVFGLGAGKLKGMGKIGAIAKIGAAIRRKT